MRALFFLLLMALSVNCFATLPFTITSGHPRVYLNAQRVSQIQAAVAESTPLNGTGFPQAQGTIEFDIKPTFNTNVVMSGCGGTYVCRGVFDDYDSARNHIFIRESFDTASPPAQGTARYQIALQNAIPNIYVAVTTITLTTNQWHTIRVSWNSTASTASVQVDGNSPVNLALSRPWVPSDQAFVFSGRDVIDNVKVYNSDTKLPGSLIADFPFDENGGVFTTDIVAGVKAYLATSTAWAQGNQGSALQFYTPPYSIGSRTLPTSPLKDAYISTSSLANGYATTLNSGGSVVDPSTSHPNSIIAVAQTIGLAYLVTGQAQYSDAIFKYADQLINTPYNVGGEYVQAGRIAAMGVVYDWAYDLAGTKYTASGLTYRAALSNAIKATLSDSTGCLNGGSGTPQCGTSTIQGSVCGYNNTFDSSWQCKTGILSPAYQIGGHSIGDHYKVLTAALAIIDENPDIEGLLSTLYGHYFDTGGIYSTREWINLDGGSQMGWAYSSGHTELDSAKLWETGTNVTYPDSWQSKQFLRYIYGLRGDYFYPASGDNYTFNYLSSYSNSAGSPFPLWAAAHGTVSDSPYAQSFYNNLIRPNLPSSQNRINELLFWQGDYAEASLEDLPYSKLLANSGEVLIRDTWDIPNATLLEFKSTSFWSENHHHLDQNEFTIFYKAPLLVDSGHYDSYGTSHWNNYYTRSIAHNTVTIWDPAETFSKHGNYHSNDGGQKFVSPFYPKLSDVEAGGSNHFDGVVAYEYTPEYTYSVGNASKAYSASKLDQANGFVRSVLFLRAPTFWQKPLTVVFDRVKAVSGKEGLTKRFLLHTLNEPEPLGGTSPGAGVYQMSGNVVTIRNGGGMLFSQTVLPENPTIIKIGGKDASNDYRFMAPSNGSSNYSSGLSNFSTTSDPNNDSDLNNDLGDIGAWRVEVSSSTPLGQEYFLHVMSVADNGSVSSPPPTQNISSTTIAGVLLGSNDVEVFSKQDNPTQLVWNMPVQSPAIRIMGLAPNAVYKVSLSYDAASSAPYKVAVTQDNTGGFTSSSQGVLVINTPLPLEPVVLSVAKSGNGGGIVTSSPSGINCGATCSVNHAVNTAVSLTATAANDSVFGSWNGCDSVSGNNCMVNMNASRTVTAIFNGLPDLVTSAISGPTTGITGTSIAVNATTANTGTAAAVASSTVIYLSTDAAITAADMRLGTVNIGGLVVGASSPNALSVPLPSGLVTGTYYLGAIADATGSVTEGNASGTGESNNAKTGNVIQISGVPAAPSNLAAKVNSKTKITLTWNDNATDESGFKIERSTNGTTFTQIATRGANANTYANSGLAANTLYYYRVRANNARGNSDYSNTVSARTNP